MSRSPERQRSFSGQFEIIPAEAQGLCECSWAAQTEGEALTRGFQRQAGGGQKGAPVKASSALPAVHTIINIQEPRPLEADQDERSISRMF